MNKCNKISGRGMSPDTGKYAEDPREAVSGVYQISGLYRFSFGQKV